MSKGTNLAQRTAHKLSASTDEAGVREFLAFELGDECYALPLSSVREIMRVPAVTEVPRAPADVMGIMSVRGTVTTLIDLRRKLKMPVRDVTSRTRVLLVDEGNEIIGLLVDTVAQVYRLREDEVELASVLGGESSAYVMGIGRPGRGTAFQQEDEESFGLDADHQNILILLDPIALLKKYGGRGG